MGYSLLFSKEVLFFDSPFEILSKPDTVFDASTFVVHTGLPALGNVLLAGAIFSAVILLLANLAKLIIVNYPKTVAQTKEKVADICMVVSFIAAFAFIADSILTLITAIFY